MSRTILIIDDEPSILHSLSGALGDEGYRTLTAANAAQGIDLLKKERPDLLLLDIWMPDVDGLSALNEIRQQGNETPIIMMSGHGTVETAVKATKLGAYDFVEKPIELDRLLVLIRNAIAAKDLLQENKALRGQTATRRPLIAESPAMKQVAELIKRVAPTSGSVLITGENGTGKEVVAKTIHALSNRFKKPFIEVNCAAIPEELIESELFGHEKGAFTGAVQLRRGRFDLADSGTLFLDEIGDMSLKTQAKVLRILQEQKFERVGGHDTHSIDVRIIAATNKDLKQEIEKGLFREDLYFRLNVVRIHLPPLRERPEDIASLAATFLREFSVLHQKPERTLSEDALQALTQHSWPGNVRELRNLLERLVILQGEGSHPITLAELKPHLSDGESTAHPLKSSPAVGKPLKDAKSEFERDYIIQALRENDWNISKTAQALEIERSYLHRRMKSFGIDEDES